MKVTVNVEWRKKEEPTEDLEIIIGKALKKAGYHYGNVFVQGTYDEDKTIYPLGDGARFPHDQIAKQIETPQPGRPLLTTTLMRSETKRKKKDMQLIVEKKSVYGNQLIYPVCNKAKLFSSISGNKTLLPEVIEDIKKLGYNLTTKGEQI